jgi:hypothetical protein
MDLRRIERYAELLGHELVHAVWVFADSEQARLAQRLPRERREQARRIVAAGTERGAPGPGGGARPPVEAPAEATEETI